MKTEKCSKCGAEIYEADTCYVSANDGYNPIPLDKDGGLVKPLCFNCYGRLRTFLNKKKAVER